MIWLARAIWLLAVMLAIVAVMVEFGGRERIVAPGLPEFPPLLLVSAAIVGGGYSTAGLLVLQRRVRHAVGWMLLIAGPAILGVILGFALAPSLVQQGNPLGAWLYLVTAIGWWPAFLLAGPALALLFPDGRLPGPRWRQVAGAMLVLILGGLMLYALRPGPILDGGPENPIGVEALPDWLYAALDAISPAIFLGPLLVAAAAVVVRFARAQGDERPQMKWYTFAVLVWVTVFVASSFASGPDLAVLALSTFVLVPAAVVIAITRYRLYEIDALINRTVVYLVLIGIVAGLYAAMVVLFQRIFVAVTGNTSDAAVVISALVLAAIFHPIRKQIENVVDRRFKTPVAPPASATVPWDDPSFEMAVERVVLRVLADERRVE